MVSQFYQLDRLVVEGGISVWSSGEHPGKPAKICGSRLTGLQGKQKGSKGDVARQKDQGYV